MSKHLNTDLLHLERNLLALSDRVEAAVHKAIQSLEMRRVDMAEEVIRGDDEIDHLEVALEEECLKVLALHQPVAGDLRFVTSCMKITNDLERIGDLSVNIAKRTRALGRLKDLHPPTNLSEMAVRVNAMLRGALEAFIQEDGDKARKILKDDDRVDELHKACISEMIELMSQDPSMIPHCMSYISVSRYLERTADHTTNIAEDVIYLSDGDIVRHQTDDLY